MRPIDSPSPTGDLQDAALLTRLMKGLLRTSLLEAIPIVVGQLAPLLLDAIRPSVESSATGSAATYVTPKQAGRMMACHPTTVRRLVREGKLGLYKLENDLRIKVSDIHAYMARARGNSPSIDLKERALEILGVHERDGGGRG